jgi:hypothetical protein
VTVFIFIIVNVLMLFMALEVEGKDSEAHEVGCRGTFGCCDVYLRI